MGGPAHRRTRDGGGTLCRTDAVPDGGCSEVRLGTGEPSLLLYRNAHDVRGYVNSCPHFSLPLNARPDRFLLLSAQRIMCAWHCAVFRLDDGVCTEGPATGMSLQPVAVRIVGEHVVWDGE